MENNVPYIEIVPECSEVTGTDDSKEEADSKGMCKLLKCWKWKFILCIST